MLKSLSFIGAFLIGSAALAADVEYYRPKEYIEAKFPFSRAVRVDDLLFLSGDLGVKDGKLVPGGIKPEAEQTLKNIRDTLAHFGLNMNDVVKCTVFLADISEWAAFNEVYVTFFDRHFPARSALGASGLALGARVEVECIAAFGASHDGESPD